MFRESEERLKLFLDLSWRSVMELRKSPDQFWGAVDAFAGGLVSWDQAASNGVLKEVRSWWLPWGLVFQLFIFVTQEKVRFFVVAMGM
jgi:hypothetical protein